MVVGEVLVVEGDLVGVLQDTVLLYYHHTLVLLVVVVVAVLAVRGFKEDLVGMVVGGDTMVAVVVDSVE